MTTATTNTIPALKTTFLTAQIRILSQPLQPEKAQPRRRKSGATSGAIPDNVLRDVTRDVNRRIRRHAKEVYSSLAVRAVAEQIDNLYWAQAGEGLEDAEEDWLEAQGRGGVGLDEDLAEERNIPRIPATLEDIAADDAVPTSTVRALEKQLESLEALAEQRGALRKKLASYNTLLDALEPFKQPQESVQPNLVTKDGPLAAELVRMRTLSLRVNSRLGEWIEGKQGEVEGGAEGEEQEEEEEWMDGQKQLRKVLGM